MAVVLKLNPDKNLGFTSRIQMNNYLKQNKTILEKENKQNLL
jgi:hypothetical protein